MGTFHKNYLEKSIATYPPLDYALLMGKLMVKPNARSKQKHGRGRPVWSVKRVEKTKLVGIKELRLYSSIQRFWRLQGIKSNFKVHFLENRLNLSICLKKPLKP